MISLTKIAQIELLKQVIRRQHQKVAAYNYMLVKAAQAREIANANYALREISKSPYLLGVALSASSLES